MFLFSEAKWNQPFAFLFTVYRDFAYVARDRLTRIHMCHVFRCDTAARTIANTLRLVCAFRSMIQWFIKQIFHFWKFHRDICKRIMIERSLQLDSNGMNTNGARCATRPTDLPTENRRWIRHRTCARIESFSKSLFYKFFRFFNSRHPQHNHFQRLWKNRRKYWKPSIWVRPKCNSPPVWKYWIQPLRLRCATQNPNSGKM